MMSGLGLGLGLQAQVLGLGLTTRGLGLEPCSLVNIAGLFVSQDIV